MVVTSVSEYQDVVAESSWGFVQKPTNFTRLYYIQGGEAYYKDEDCFFQFEEGKLYLLPVEKEYILYHNPKNKLNHLFCHITTIPRITNPLIIPIQENELAYDSLLLLKKHIKSKDVSFILKCIELLITSLPDELFWSCGMTDSASLIKRYIEDNIENEISLEIIAAEFGYSKTYLIKKFRSIYGITPIQYLQQKRLETAIMLLRDGETIESITRKFHYSNASNFSLFFKKKYVSLQKR